jgi:hypothetical protein
VWTRYIAGCKSLDEAALAAGRTPDERLPDPDDIIIGGCGRVCFVGPCIRQELLRVEKNIRLRDLLVLQDAYDARVGVATTEGRYKSSALLFAIAINQALPPRLQWSDEELTFRMMKAENIQKLELLKRLYRGWQSAGIPLPRGKIFPPVGKAVRMFERGLSLLQRMQNGEIDANAFLSGRIDAQTAASIADWEKEHPAA